MVVQCPTCQSKFRIADDKVTDRGVRVRCTSCKNVFQVKKPGAASTEPAPGPGSTVQLSALDAAQVARPPARSGASRPPPAPSTAPRAGSRPPATARGSNGTARRLQTDDLFGMAELTGEAPLAVPEAPKPPPAKAMPNFDDIDLEVDDATPPPLPSRPPPRPARQPPPRSDPPPADPAAASAAPEKSAAAPPPPPPAADAADAASDESGVTLGAFKSPLKDPFEGMNLGEPGTGAIELATQPKKDKLAEAVKAEEEAAATSAAATAEPPPPPAPEIPPGREMVSSALTGLVGAALAIAFVIAAALSDDAAAGWLGIGRSSDVVATRVVSGLYDTASGKPVFFVRGRIENRSKKVRGPVRVTAELISDGTAAARAEAIAGAEPSAEDVWSLRSSADVDKLTRTLELSDGDRKLQPGSSLPFFAVFADPPADLQRHRLHLKVESVDAWNPPPAKAGKGR